jgi:tripartite ATP-independent transporter DctM subunit
MVGSPISLRQEPRMLDDVILCLCACANWLDIAMVVTLCVLLLAGFPAAFTLAGVALAYGLIGLSMGAFDTAFLEPLPLRIFGIVNNEVLLAVPLFILMGVILERAKIAEELLDTMARAFGSLRGGLGISVMVVGALLAASTGIVGATVVTMGLLSLPTMLKRGYSPSIAAGTVAAAGTLGQIIPPSIVLILLGDVLANAYQEAQLRDSIFAPETVSVGDLFAGALIPGLLLVGFYIVYLILIAIFQGRKMPPVPAEERFESRGAALAALRSLPAPLLLIVAVLGSILTGIATPSEAAALGAVGALLIAGSRRAVSTERAARLLSLSAIVALLFVFALADMVDLRMTQEERSVPELVAIVGAIIACGVGLAGAIAALRSLAKAQILRGTLGKSAEVTGMVFMILIGAALFSLVFRGLGGDETVASALAAIPGGTTGALIAVMAIMFVLGFFLDFIEITLVVVPLVAPSLLAMGVDPVWLGVLMAVNLQTSFLTPPFGFALFYLRGVAPPELRTTQIYRGALPFVVIQLLMLALLAIFPELATGLPDAMAAAR